MDHGIGPELHGIDLGDERLNRRSRKVLEALAANPQASINAACSGWSETLAAYRFFDNPAVEPEKILAPHQEATKQRVQAQPVVLVIQDTTEFDFTSHPPQDAGCLDKWFRFGFYDHTHLAVTPERLCLGVVGAEQFDRTPESLGKTDERVNWPIEDKESFRWLTGYRIASKLVSECPATQIVSVADSEADIYDIFVDAQKQESGAEFLIRAKEHRATPRERPRCWTRGVPQGERRSAGLGCSHSQGDRPAADPPTRSSDSDTGSPGDERDGQAAPCSFTPPASDLQRGAGGRGARSRGWN